MLGTAVKGGDAVAFRQPTRPPTQITGTSRAGLPIDVLNEIDLVCVPARFPLPSNRLGTPPSGWRVGLFPAAAAAIIVPPVADATCRFQHSNRGISQ